MRPSGLTSMAWGWARRDRREADKPSSTSAVFALLCYSCTSMLPRTQGELIRSARAELSQASFAKQLGVDRTCLCRYESEALGAPSMVINACLQILAQRISSREGRPQEGSLALALEDARRLVRDLERLSERESGLRVPR